MPLTSRVRTAPAPIFRTFSESASWWTQLSAAYVWNFQVILECLRMASIISFTFREAVVDVEYKGKDWSYYGFFFFQNLLWNFGADSGNLFFFSYFLQDISFQRVGKWCHCSGTFITIRNSSRIPRISTHLGLRYCNIAYINLFCIKFWFSPSYFIYVFSGSSKTEYFSSIWWWCPCLSWKWARQARDPHLNLSPSYQVRVRHPARMHFQICKNCWFQWFYRISFLGFRWEVVGSQSGVEYGPFPIPQNGLPARFWRVQS